MTYRIEIGRAAQKQLAGLGHPIRPRLIEAIRNLADEPRPPGCCKLTGRDAWRIRVGTYRIIYEIHDGTLVVTVVDLGHRRDIYR